MKSKFLTVLAAVILGVSFAATADAHTTSIGYVPGLNPGEVTFWTGSYLHGGTPVNEGTLTLTGISGTVYGPVVKAFDLTPVSTKPAGLVDGTNNFFWAGDTSFPLSVDPVLFGGVAWWQGVTFAGLNPGDYSFSCGATCGTTVQWASFGTGVGTLNLQGRDIGGGGSGNTVPEPASMVLLGSGLLGAFVRRSRKQS